MANSLDQKTLKEILDYNPDTGELFWRHRTPDMFSADKLIPAEHICNLWNSKYSGKQAFTATDKHGYKHGSIKGRYYKAHRLIYTLWFGVEPEQIDHINHNRSDNRVKNLRSISHQENGKNQKRPSNNKSGVVGVQWCIREAKWLARITSNKRRICLGYFKSKSEAIAVRKAAEIKHGFHKNHGKAV